MHFLPARAKSQSKQVEYVFSLRKPLSTGKPGKSDKSEVANSVFSGHSSKAEKSTFFHRKSARNCPPTKAVRSQKSVKTAKSVYVEKKDSSSKIFQYKSVSFFGLSRRFLSFFSHCLNALSARKSEKSVEASRICLFSAKTTFSWLTRKV